MRAAPANLGALFSPARDPAAIALIDLGGESGPREYTYAELDAQADGVARGLRARGLPAGARAAILSANRMEFLAAYLGIMRAGLIAVPVNYRLPPDSIDFILRDSGAALVFCDGPRRDAYTVALPSVEFGAGGAGGYARFLDPGPCEAARPADDQPALFLYTSGSTGRPKGVKISHAGYLWTVRQRTASTDYGGHCFLVAAPLYHMNALNTIKLALAGQGRLVLMPQFSPAGYLDAIERYRCTWLTAIPTMIALLARETGALAGADLASVAMVRLGSEPLTQRIADSARAMFPRAAFGNGYGATETGALVFGPHPQGLAQPVLSVGYPHPAVQLRLADGADLDAATGVLQVRSPALMLGYHGLPEQTAAAMTHDGFYITGDVMRRDEHGFHYFIGRADDMFVCGGENIYPGEVEKMLERHPAIVQACIVPLADPLKGMKPVALVVSRPDATLSEQEVKDYALAHGPAYQHPRAVRFVAEMPISSTGKVNRKAAALLAAELIAAASPLTQGGHALRR
ncbi:class I adenylate-forming enzyme family protein [Bordetella bronchiseptica]|uniref:class I adenylate-forming enzyme family protein n=1 Tax=Bordetella bronchiseptica TaxID=518 RepID=UPI000461F1EA|nr:class I adenylate-forming enzyme family protein [Bordetella bronchiseptica]KDC61032.1 AMP-binding enzyme [Bordetella bronchiseptica MBORD591]